MPFWLAQVLSQEKFFARNPVIGSRWLNERGLHFGMDLGKLGIDRDDY